MRLSRESFAELFGYGLGTILAFAVDVGLLTLLVSGLGVHYALATAISFTVGGIVLYSFSVRWVFRHRRISDGRIELPAFIALGLVGLALQTILMVAIVQHLHVHYLMAKVAAAGCTFLVNFALRRSLLFSPARLPAPP